MTGYYGYLPHKKEWYWKIVIMNTEVISGYCKNKKELNEILDKHPLVNWYEDIEVE